MANKMAWTHAGTKSVFDAVDHKTNGLASDFLKTDNTKYVIQNAYEMACALNDLVTNGTHITIIGDYDADGVCSTAELYMTLRTMGATDITLRLPRRMSEGYGLRETIVDEINNGAIVTVDNGIAAIPAIKKAKEKGLAVYIIDHHLPPIENGHTVLPDADLIVDPNVDDSLICKGTPVTTTFRSYCAAGVVYKIAEIMTPDRDLLNELSTLAAIATIADVVDLTGDNRNIFHEGTKNMADGYMTAGTAMLINVLYSDGHVSEGDIGFKLAPMLNAPGRLYDDGANKSLNVVLCNNEQQAKTFVEDLSNDNDFRKREKSRACERAFEMIAENHMEHNNPIVIVDPKTAQGIVGLVSGEITETFNQSSFVFTEKDGAYHGSGRAAQNDNLKASLDAVNAEDPEIFLGYGGHKGAAGVTIRKEKLGDFSKLMAKAMGGPHELPDSITYDLEISPEQLQYTATELDKFRPFGQGNPDLIVRIDHFKPMPDKGNFYKKIGTDTVKFLSPYGEAIGFSMLQDYLELGKPTELDLLGTISWHYFRGDKTPQIEIIDMKASQAIKQKPTNLQQSVFDLLQQNQMA